VLRRGDTRETPWQENQAGGLASRLPIISETRLEGSSMSDCFDHAVDAFDDLCFGQTNDEGMTQYTKYTPTPVRCKFCGVSDLYWAKTAGRWVLLSNGLQHDCRPPVETVFRDF
jgi:hypothetical protein